MTMEKSLVSISRKWHEPFVRVDVTDVGIGVTVTLSDFITALATELSAPVPLLEAAAERVCEGLKLETRKAM